MTQLVRIPDGMRYMDMLEQRIAALERQNAALGAAAPVIPRVSSLPASPVDGQECCYVADATNGVLWHLCYNAASASAYKWEFVGGSPLLAESYALVSTYTTGSPAFTFGPALAALQITLPLAGDWIVQHAVNLQVVANVNDWRAALFLSGSQIGTGAMGATSTTMYGANLVQEQMRPGLTASTVLDVRITTNVASSTCQVYDRSLRAQPVRVG